MIIDSSSEPREQKSNKKVYCTEQIVVKSKVSSRTLIFNREFKRFFKTVQGV